MVHLFFEKYFDIAKYIPQKRFTQCRDKRPLPFDFYLPDYNICVECQGKQHYIAMEYFGGEKQLKNQLLHDEIKRNYCKKENIKLIEISYLEFKDDSYKNILEKEITQPYKIGKLI